MHENNFLTYKRGVLRLDENSKKVGGNFVVKLVGWQKKKDIMVWVVDPMFGTGYGDNGLVYVSMENEEEFGEVALSMRLFEEAVSGKRKRKQKTFSNDSGKTFSGRLS